MASMRSLRRPVNLQQVWVQLFTQYQTAIKTGAMLFLGIVAAYGHPCQWGPPATRTVSDRGCSNPSFGRVLRFLRQPLKALPLIHKITSQQVLPPIFF